MAARQVAGGRALSVVSIAPLQNRPSYIKGMEDDPEDIFDVVSVGSPFKYVIPSFDVLAVELRRMRIVGQHRTSGDEKRYDLFIRNDSSLARPFPARIIVTDLLVIEKKEFGMSANIRCLQLPPQGVLVVWEWEWARMDEESSQRSDTEEEYCEEEHNPYLHSDTESSSDTETEPKDLPPVTHTVTFKCVGSVHDLNKQLVLSKVSKLLREKNVVQARIRPEPDNQFDSKAICFECFVDQKWEAIGYVVRECLDYIHEALKERCILSVEIAWAKYLVCWSQSGPGFYAGINITRQGEWHQQVVRSQSTR